jgi:glutamate-1-semialdehyde 2,1-aminomutase
MEIQQGGFATSHVPRSPAERRYAALWPRAGESFERATKVMPGGNTRTQLYVAPFPVYGATAQGSQIELVDGAVVDDFLLNYTASAVGHGNPKVDEAVAGALSLGSPFGVPSESEIALASQITERFGVDRVRFTSSGSEATWQAIRGARAFTGKSRIAKAEGGYHGGFDLVDVSVTKFGDSSCLGIPETPGMGDDVLRSVTVFPYNDLDGALERLQPHADDLAAIIIEVFLNSGGSIPGDPDYLRGLQRWCADNDVLLIVDEVATWRTSFAGAACDYGISPDLLCLGKALGGGFAIGAFSGREDVMAVFDPRQSGFVRHAGTFNAHPVTMVAGRTVLEILDPATVLRMSQLGNRITEGIVKIGNELDLPLTASNYGSIGRIHFGRRPPRNAREASDFPSRIDLHRLLLERNILIGPEGRFSTCSETTGEQVDRLLEVVSEMAPIALRGMGLSDTAAGANRTKECS